MPVLKGKEGEFKALEESPADLKLKLSPIIELVNYNPPKLSAEKLARRKKPLRNYDDYLSDNLKNIVGFWNTDNPLFIDTHLIPEHILIPSAKMSNIELIHTYLEDSGVVAIPVIHTNFSTTKIERYKKVIEKSERGMCLRLEGEDFDKEDLSTYIQSFLELYELKPDAVDLVLDYGFITSGLVLNMARSIAQTINKLIPHLDMWRSLTIVSGAFPIDLSNLKPDSINTLEKSDWKLWNAIRSKKLKRLPAYGDYAIAHPIYTEIDPTKITMSAGIRYTGADDWIVVKGRSVKTHKFSQIHELAAKVVGLREYDGPHFSQGDEWIHKCSVCLTGTGNASTWRQVGSNRHFHKVISLLSTLDVI